MQVWLNGAEIINSENAFVRHEVDVTDNLRAAKAANLSTSELRIVLRAAPQETLRRRDTYPVTVLGQEYFPGAGGAPGTGAAARFLRKDLSSWGWDWGVSLAPPGVWGTPRIDVTPIARLSRTATRVTASGGAAPGDPFTVEVHPVVSKATADASSCAADLPQPPQLSLRTRLLDANGTAVMDNDTPVPDASPLVMDLQVGCDQVALWWPRGMGAQPLYTLQMDLRDTASSEVLDSLTRRLGFRHVAVAEDAPPAQGEQGRLMQLVVNGVPFFAKGANVIPVDVLQSRETATAFSRLLLSAAEANMNVLRVWGGGHYMPDAFYDTADELGLLIWQEMMFACNEFPTDAAFLANVRVEVADVVARVGHHASIGLWSGNNENMYYVNRQDTGPRNTTAYSLLYDSTVRAELAKWDPHRAFWASSPSNGMLVDDVGMGIFVQRYGQAGDGTQGDLHYYNYKAPALDLSLLPATRFMSEFGWQSFPSLGSLANQTDPSLGDWDEYSPLFRWRQNHPNGTHQIAAMLARYFDPPTGGARSTVRFDAYAYQTQLLQARVIASWAATYRRLRDTPGVYCRGTLYWQLNDVWLSPTWSSVEYGGHWKMLHYAMKRVYRNVSAVAWATNGTFSVTVIADGLPGGGGGAGGELRGVSVVVEAHAWDGTVAQSATSEPFDLPAHSAVLGYTADAQSVLGTMPRDGGLVRVRLLDASGGELARDTYFPNDLHGGFRGAALEDPKLSTRILSPSAAESADSADARGDSVTVNVCAAKPAVGVLLEAGGGPGIKRIAGRWSDNGFAMVAGECIDVVFTSWDGEPIDTEALDKMLRVQHLYMVSDRGASTGAKLQSRADNDEEATHTTQPRESAPVPARLHQRHGVRRAAAGTAAAAV